MCVHHCPILEVLTYEGGILIKVCKYYRSIKQDIIKHCAILPWLLHDYPHQSVPNRSACAILLPHVRRCLFPLLVGVPNTESPVFWDALPTGGPVSMSLQYILRSFSCRPASLNILHWQPWAVLIIERGVSQCSNLV